jgi:hypothetical protein
MDVVYLRNIKVIFAQNKGYRAARVPLPRPKGQKGDCVYENLH